MRTHEKAQQELIEELDAIIRNIVICDFDNKTCGQPAVWLGTTTCRCRESHPLCEEHHQAMLDAINDLRHMKGTHAPCGEVVDWDNPLTWIRL